MTELAPQRAALEARRLAAYREIGRGVGSLVLAPVLLVIGGAVAMLLPAFHLAAVAVTAMLAISMLAKGSAAIGRGTIERVRVSRLLRGLDQPAALPAARIVER